MVVNLWKIQFKKGRKKKKNMFLVIYNEFHFKTAELLPKMETTLYYIIIKMHEDFFFCNLTFYLP